MVKKSALLLALICSSLFLLAQTPKRKIEAIHTTIPIKIDGILDEEIWQKAPIATDFIQHSPYGGEKATARTEVKLVYDNNSLYVGAVMYDSPENITTELSKRDDRGNNDAFIVALSPFNDGINAYEFWVMPSEIQLDRKILNGKNGFETNKNWDAVWKSKVNRTDKAWIVEMEIPYSEIRFPKSPKQIWGLNLWRYRNKNREWTSFNFVDPKIQGALKQAGELHGIRNIEPPLRLSLTPYLSNSFEKNRETSNWKNKFGGGLDVKYGINESFTLDMMLVPDFSEVESDDQILNLTPFETKFEEKRQFFTEGAELFSKGGIFYSKRIGKKPSGHGDIKDALDEGTYKEIKENPIETKLINATKLSGRTNKGLGIGFFNAMTNNTYAKVVDENDVERRVLTDPFTNYNMLVLDQTLKNNSYLSFMNTNVWKERDEYMANVTGTDFRFENKSNSYSLSGKAILSQIYQTGNDEYGYTSNLKFEKISGNFRFDFSNLIESDKYDPNDFGYLQNNNEVTNILSLKYNVYKPVGNILSSYNFFRIIQSSLYKPFKHTDLSLNLFSETTFKNYLKAHMHFRLKPYEEHDYFEARVDGRKFTMPRSFHVCGSIITDTRKHFSIFLFGGVNKSYSYHTNQLYYTLEFEPRLRINGKSIISYSGKYSKGKNDIGYVNRTDDDQTIYFGNRETNTLTNTFTANYIFNNKSSLSFRARHYWSRADYKEFFELQDNGLIQESNYSDNHDINYNAFNIDFVYNWRFAPGSELSIIWKTAIDEEEDLIRTNSFRKNFKNALDLPSASSLSIKLLYYLDWRSLKI